MIIMGVKKIGISPDLIIHPGETIADVLEDRGITQKELAVSTGVTPAYVSNVIAGKKDISAKFAAALEYALNVPKSFWLNLQARYEAERLAFYEADTVTDEERAVRNELKDIVKYLRVRFQMPLKETIDVSILSLRKVFQVNSLCNLKRMVPQGAFRMERNASVKPAVLGAWLRLCQIIGDKKSISAVFDIRRLDDLIYELKQIMLNRNADIQHDLQETLGNFGINFCIVQHFQGAPVHGYITSKQDGTYQMYLTIRRAYADIFWFSLFHELGHIVNGDISKNGKFIDTGLDEVKEKKADAFASNRLLSMKEYTSFVAKNDFRIEAIQSFAREQHVMPFIVIGRLQKEKKLDYTEHSRYKVRYKWV